MSTAYEMEGRSAQKLRTRAALVAAAQELVSQGLTPTVEDAAAAAQISRTTAYRYFPNQRVLLGAAHPETAASSLLPRNPPDDVRERVAIVVKAFTKLILETEEQQRTMLRLSLEQPQARDELPLRQGRAIAWFAEALEPARAQLGDTALRRLALALRAATGIEALVWLKDIACLSNTEFVRQALWTGDALVRAALEELG